MRARFYYLLLFIVILMIGPKVMAQERMGISMSNYAGSQGIVLNPSSILNSKLYMDINLLSINLSGQNNYLYIPAKDYSLGHMFRQLKKANNDEEPDMLEQSYDHGRDAHGFINASVYGPSVMYSINNHAFAIHSSFRSHISGKNIPYEQMNFAYVDVNLLSQLGENYIDEEYWVNAAAWMEVGLTYAGIIKRDYNRHLSGGITIKRLLSYAGFVADFDKMDYVMQPDGHAFVNDADFKFAYALPVNYSTNTSHDEIKPLGKGWGFDLGITYKFLEKGYEVNRYRKACEQEFEDYYFKLGVSLLDLGSINYKSNARLHHYYGAMEWEDIHLYDPPSVAALSQEISTRFFNDPGQSLSDTAFKIGLPTSLSVQTDYKYNDKLYFGTLTMLPLKISEYQLRRPALLAFIPRYETKKFEASLPVSFHDFYELRLGLSLRLGFLTIGTDKLGTLVGLSNFDGFDFYTMIKFNFHKGKCSNRFIDVCRQD